MAKKLGLQPGGLRTSISKLIEQGYLIIEGKSAEWVYPTVATLRWQNPELDEAEAAKIPAAVQALGAVDPCKHHQNYAGLCEVF